MAEKQKQDANNGRFSIKMQKKLVVLYVAVLLAFVLLCVRLVWITREKGTQYEKQVLSQQKYDSTVIPYRRGDIVDSKGTILATSEKVYNLVIDAKVMNYAYRDKLPYLEPTLEALGNYFDLDMAKIREYVTANKNSSYYVPLKRLSRSGALRRRRRRRTPTLTGSGLRRSTKECILTGALPLI